MTDQSTDGSDAVDLRRRAEMIAKGHTAQSPVDVEALSAEEIRRLLHELRVHQIELETQNEELRHAQLELEASRARYFDLYDLAPVGYVTVSEKGLILEANLTLATLLGVPRRALNKQPITQFIFREDQDHYYGHRKQIFETGERQACDLRMLRAGTEAFWARLEFIAAQDDDGARVCRIALSDITEHKEAEEALQKAFDDIRTLRGIVPICSNCKDIRNDRGYWEQVEVYVRDHTEADFTHGMCPNCMKELYPEYGENNDSEPKEKRSFRV